MSGSGNKINYNVRAAKSVERRMLLDAVKELFKFHDSKACRYVGFGSFYFTDYKLIHKELHLNKMVSFEMDPDDLVRAHFNQPYKCIQIISGKSTNKLPDIDWNSNLHDFIWLDYDDNLNADMFNDCEIVFSNISPGSVFVMTSRRQLNIFKTPDDIKDTFGNITPFEIEKEDLTGVDSRDVKLIRAMYMNQIAMTLESRNIILDEDDKLAFYPLFLFSYRDGAAMMSFGGYIDKAVNGFDSASLGLKNHDFIREDDEPFKIEVPILTFKELHLINKHLPSDSDLSDSELAFIPETDREQYRMLYKYLPNYMDVVY